jgi:hypothetical protein
MHMLYCLYSASASGVWRYSPCFGGFSSFRMIHGLTRPSFSRKSVRSPTRSRITGKPRSGSTRIGPGPAASRYIAQVSVGSPFTIMPQLPHTPMRQAHRYESVPSRVSLI